jgi:hypothetical protein
MSQRLDGVREANCGLGLLTPFILQKSRMCRRARTDLRRGCALKLMKFSLLKWRPRQSLARSRVPSLA